MAGERDDPLSTLCEITLDDIPMAAIVAGISAVGPFLNENGDLPKESLGYALQEGLRSALEVCISQAVETKLHGND